MGDARKSRRVAADAVAAGGWGASDDEVAEGAEAADAPANAAADGDDEDVDVDEDEDVDDDEPGSSGPGTATASGMTVDDDEPETEEAVSAASLSPTAAGSAVDASRAVAPPLPLGHTPMRHPSMRASWPAARTGTAQAPDLHVLAGVAAAAEGTRMSSGMGASAPTSAAAAAAAAAAGTRDARLDIRWLLN
ncbi:hypothetical protein AMAG_19398 [Allomyces macrogynus ATCC 38327]|uniref:Uncharacterized protein n=1 Tax=Allomyces macrogynus (strain ATCC 38327) TaxID=578462 RepID=A0A0L0SQT2_ALLM3|nr:hypothetical protein AMAG_19398 [Allomyces macrogynus ATCC 38327]|eukprot:KNE64898.1 hypothetical protein AMAG_19398 [Allomyces macrogynus ATCC 38327]